MYTLDEAQWEELKIVYEEHPLTECCLRSVCEYFERYFYHLLLLLFQIFLTELI